MKHMVILVCSPGAEDPEVRMIENTLEECQKVVGGRIEIALTSQSFPKDILVICNEEGLLEDLPPNRFGMDCPKIVITGIMEFFNACL